MRYVFIEISVGEFFTFLYDGDLMAKLTEPMKIFIVQSLACFETPQQVADAVKSKFKVEIDRMQCAGYDPTKATGEKMAKKLKDLFYKTRDEFKSNVYGIPLANKAVRLNELQKMYDDWGKNKVMRQNVLKQAQGLLQSGKSAGPSGLSEKEQIEIEIKRLELEKLQKEVRPPATRPPEEDYKVELRPDEEIPNEPIL